MPAVDPAIVRCCCEYVRLVCKSRGLMRQRRVSPEDNLMARSLLGSARMLYDTAPPGARPYLDIVKNVLNGKPKLEDVGAVLLEASLLL